MRRPGSLLLLAAAAWAAIAVALFLRDHVYALYDDAYIYFTYADHLVSGCGLRFRCDAPPVEGFTSPLYQGILVLARLATADLESVAQVAGALALFATLLFTAESARRARRDDDAGGVVAAVCGAAAVVYLGAHDHVLVNAVIGLETPLAMLAVTMLVRAALDPAAPGLRAWLALATLARPECAVFVVAAPLLPVARRLRWWWPLVAFGAATVAARWLVFHDVLPNTVWAKGGGTREHLALGVAYVGELLRDVPLLAAAPLALFARRLRPAAGFFLAGAALWLLSFLRTGGDTFSYSRLAMPLVPAGVLLGALGIADLVARATRRRVVPAAVVAVVFAAGAVHARRHALPAAHGFPNVQRWASVGDYLAEHHPGALVAVVPIGVISHRCRCRVLDLVGLTDRVIGRSGRGVPPELLGRRWIGHERHHLEHTLEERPDLIVFTRFAPRPFTDLAATSAGFFAEWLLLQEIKAGRAPYELYSPEVAPGVYWLMFRRTE